jgi:hypothetical protein
MRPLVMKAEADALVVQRATFISCRSSMLHKVGKGVRRGAMSAMELKHSSRPWMTLVTRSESETGRDADLCEGVGRGLLAVLVVADG